MSLYCPGYKDAKSVSMARAKRSLCSCVMDARCEMRSDLILVWVCLFVKITIGCRRAD